MKITFKHIPFFPIFFLIKTAMLNGGISLRRIPLFGIYILRYFLLEPFRLMELFIYDRKIRKHQLNHDPIFILGHWRSGTSHLQTLLCKDPDNVSTTLFNFLFSDTYYLTGAWLKRPLNTFCRKLKVNYAFQRVPMHLDIPGELDSGLCANCSSYAYTWGHLFPKRFDKWMDRHVLIEDEKHALNWIRDYDYLIRKLSYKNKHKQVIVKSPGDTARVEILLRKYPNAKFIYIHRAPVEVFHSSKYLWGVIQQQNSFQKISESQIDAYILQTYKKVLTKYLASRNSIPVSQLAELSFEELQHNPLTALEDIYDKLQLGPFPKEELGVFIQNNKTYKLNEYTTSVGLKEKLSVEWAFSFKAWPDP